MPPAAVTEMSLIVDEVSLAAASDLLSASLFCSVAEFELTGLFSLLPGRLLMAPSVSLGSDPLFASTVMFPPADSVTPSATFATTLECRTATVTPTPTPAAPLAAAVPDMISASITSPADTVMSPVASIVVPFATVADTASLRVLTTVFPSLPVSSTVTPAAEKDDLPDSPSAVESKVSELYDSFIAT